MTRVLRRLARSGTGVAQGDQRAAARLADDEPDLIRPFRAQFPQYPQHRRVHQRQQVVVRQPPAVFSPERVARDQHAIQLHVVELHRLQLGQSRCGQCAGGQPVQSGEQQRAVQLRHPPQLQRRRQLCIPGAVVGGGPLQIGTVFSALSGRPFTLGRARPTIGTGAVDVIRANCLADPIYN